MFRVFSLVRARVRLVWLMKDWTPPTDLPLDGVREPTKRRPGGRSSGASVPEPDDETAVNVVAPATPRAMWILALAAALCQPVAAQTPAMDPPKVIFGTWIWNPASRTELDNYQCYLERIDDVGGGRTRVRDYRIRLVKGASRDVIRNDFDVFFNTPIMRADRTSMLWRVTGARSYQLMTLPAGGGLPTFVVTRDISADGQKMTQVGAGLVNGANVRTETTFDRAPEGTMTSGECALE